MAVSQANLGYHSDPSWEVLDHMHWGRPSKLETFTQCWYNAGPLSDAGLTLGECLVFAGTCILHRVTSLLSLTATY